MSDSNGGQSWEELMQAADAAHREVTADNTVNAAHGQAILALVEAGRQQAIAYQGLRASIGSLIDIVDELAMGLAVGDTPTRPWAEMVSAHLSARRRELGFKEPGS